MWEYIVGRSTSPGAVWRAWDGLAWSDYDRDGRPVATGTGICAPAAHVKAAWDAQAPEIAAAPPPAEEQLYIRWGAIPPRERSRNHDTGRLELGVSVYAARWDPERRRVIYDKDDALPGTGLMLMMLGFPAYLVTGREVGRGSDGEPLIRRVRVIAPLIPKEDGFALQ
jgi:hypothetical protein